MLSRDLPTTTGAREHLRTSCRSGASRCMDYPDFACDGPDCVRCRGPSVRSFVANCQDVQRRRRPNASPVLRREMRLAKGLFESRFRKVTRRLRVRDPLERIESPPHSKANDMTVLPQFLHRESLWTDSNFVRAQELISAALRGSLVTWRRQRFSPM